MTIICHELHAACPPDRIWALLADLEAVERYNPGVRRARVQGPQRTGVGACRSCELVPDGRVVESGWPIHFMRWVTRLDPHDNGTRISQSLEYQVKFGPVGWLLDRVAMKRKLTATLDQVFASLVDHAEGAPTGRS